MLVWVDPPSGWMYGFPKIYDTERDGPLDKWLEKRGYPRAQDAVYTRQWPVHEQEFTDGS